MEVERFHLPPPLGSPMSESDDRINNIFTNYSSHNYIEILSRMHPMHYFIKKILEKAYIFYITQAGSITIPPHYLKIIPHLFEHEFLPPSPPTPPITIGYMTIMPC